MFIVGGRAVPEGDTVYVMVQELTRYGTPRSAALWKPSTGEGFDARDTRYYCSDPWGKCRKAFSKSGALAMKLIFSTSSS